MEDEFACPGALRGALLSLHPSLKRVFGVTMEIGAEEDAGMPHSGQIWLKLRGMMNDVTAAKVRQPIYPSYMPTFHRKKC